MKTFFRQSFLRDLKKVKDQAILARIHKVIARAEEAAGTEGIRELKKISGSADFYRIRVGDYRLGVAIEGTQVDLIRCLHRREVYRFFP